MNGFVRSVLITGFTVALAGLMVPTDALAFIAGDGKGKPERDCYIGLDGYSSEDLSPINKKGTKFGIVCTDCDPACDLDGVETANGTCTFSIAACVNQAGVEGCDPATRETKKTSAKAKSKAGKLDLSSTLPADGSSACSAFVDFPVPTKKNGKKTGKGKVILKATKKTDKDVFQFRCDPRPEGEACPIPTTTSTSTTTTTTLPFPDLVGLDPNKPFILPITVQAAYNDDTMFFHIGWEGDRGDTHDHVHFTGGAWQREGFPRREAQSTIDNDPARGPTNRTSTIYESRVTWIIDDPSGPNAVADFDRYGCFLTCHDQSRAMPTWNPAENFTKYLNDGTAGSLDLWHHRLARANPIGASDDQNVGTVPPLSTDGGRFGDAGDSPWQTNNIDGVTGLPTYALDPATTGGLFAFDFADVFGSPLRSFRRDDAPENGPGPVPVGIDFADAELMGYVPAEGDTIPRRRLRQPTGSRGDITSLGTTFTQTGTDPLIGLIGSNTQRLLDTGNADDTALADGNVYNVAFAVHTGMVTVRDHYVGFPMTLSLGGGTADIDAVKIAGTGTGTLPDFSNTTLFPVVDSNLFLPGITSLEFVNGDNTGLTYIDPVTSNPVDQNHAGDTALLTGGLGCRDCHTSADADPFNPPNPGGFNAGSMETLVTQRGGINTPTPIPPAP